jgi:hypothetical protein
VFHRAAAQPSTWLRAQGRWRGERDAQHRPDLAGQRAERERAAVLPPALACWCRRCSIRTTATAGTAGHRSSRPVTRHRFARRGWLWLLRWPGPRLGQDSRNSWKPPFGRTHRQQALHHRRRCAAGGAAGWGIRVRRWRRSPIRRGGCGMSPDRMLAAVQNLTGALHVGHAQARTLKAGLTRSTRSSATGRPVMSGYRRAGCPLGEG